MPPRSHVPIRSDGDSTPSAEVVLDVLADEYAQSILAELRDGAKPAQELVDACEASRPTVYRRLDALEDAGVVDASVALDPDGHHRKEFSVALEAVTLDLADGAFAVADATSARE
jgi:DNA-binding transcriptional ArsR family regulator